LAETAIVVTQPGFIDAPIPGGVQVCTREYLDLLKAAGYEVLVHPIAQKRDLLTRAAIRLGVDVYGGYDVEAHARAIAETARLHPGAVVALNQVDIAPLGAALRRVAPQLPVVALSHGNSSGDYLHEAASRGDGPLGRVRNRWKLGGLLERERAFFQHDIDLVLCLSDTEAAIDQWLGARHVLVIPRTFTPQLLDWAPVHGRVGIVSTVDHHPNRAGIETFAAALSAAGADEIRIRLVGSGAAGGRELQQRFPCIEYLGQLDEPSLRREAASWSLFVHPLFWHARGASTKIATAVNWGLPIATTPAGLRGYRWRDGDIVTAAEPGDLASLVRRLARDRAALEAARADVLRVGQTGPTLIELGRLVRAGIDGARRRRASGA
jgi:hypothetical protein